VAYLPGSDPVLKGEYLVIGSHHDHNPPREGRIFPGSDDNASGCVAMFAIAKAMMVERPKRSTIFVWHTAEERGLVGAYYFVQHSPVPPEKITANLNLDMITRNDTNSIYLIGSTKISSELDKSFHDMNAGVKLALDYKYDDPAEPNRFFFRSDQYPYMRYGIPGVWIFCGTTPDYHQESDVEEKADYAKMERVTRLTYLVAMDVGNKPGLLKLDVRPEITTRGAHNMKVVWLQPLRTSAPR
jgi:Zn-dependent M28 family amino/carboxypeptidase